MTAMLLDIVFGGGLLLAPSRPEAMATLTGEPVRHLLDRPFTFQLKVVASANLNPDATQDPP